MPRSSRILNWKQLQPALLTVVLLLYCGGRSGNSLSVGYYNDKCPKAESLVKYAVSCAFEQNPLVAGAMLRLHFHDCMVQGCEGSVLLDSTESNSGEKDAPLNAGLRFFEVVDAAKAAVEQECPGVVSCADIVAFAARDAVQLTGGASWGVEAGRRDGTTSSAEKAEATLPRQTDDVLALAARFEDTMGLSLDDMVTLSGSHTIGQSLCGAFADRLRPTVDPSLPPDFAEQLLKLCPVGDNTARANLDFTSPVTFNSDYFRNLEINKGVLITDQLLYTDTISRPLVEVNAADQTFFFDKFKSAMIRMGRAGILSGADGQIRANCRLVN